MFYISYIIFLSSILTSYMLFDLYHLHFDAPFSSSMFECCLGSGFWCFAMGAMSNIWCFKKNNFVIVSDQFPRNFSFGLSCILYHVIQT